MSVFFKANPSCLLFLISSVFLTSLSTGSFFRACKLDKVLFKVFFKNTYILKKTPPVCRMGVHRDALPLNSVIGVLQPDFHHHQRPPGCQTQWTLSDLLSHVAHTLFAHCLFFLSLLWLLFHHLWILSFCLWEAE